MQFSPGSIESGLESGDSKMANSAAQPVLTRGPEVLVKGSLWSQLLYWRSS